MYTHASSSRRLGPARGGVRESRVERVRDSPGGDPPDEAANSLEPNPLNSAFSVCRLSVFIWRVSIADG